MWSIYGSETAVSETVISQLQNRSVSFPVHSLCEEMLYGEMHRNQLCRQHIASRMQEPTYSYAQGL